MKPNDQWFEPGDKVMRVSCTDFSPLPTCPIIAPWGEVLCVSRCASDLIGNLVEFVGYPNPIDPCDGVEWWEAARDFRKVEEIKLCVQAAKMAEAPKPKTIPA